ncbi:MAG: hypothetical protein J6K22_05390 [Spirochaetaceae bacterium]|nr:hypothetical protein [Spirochaetaceae bacterium]MBP3449878.1 hypothetical protein [Spirochaetaceae bacterium]MBQ7906086.1 hypothetical protein [Spirochaetaceae bacterium]
MKRFLFVIISIFVIFAQTVVAQENNDVQVSIKLYNKTLYYPGESLDNPIYVHITVANKGSETLRFKLADDRMFSIDFSAFNAKNTKLPYTEEIIKKRTTDRIVYFREIALETGEEYSFVENLKDYVQITEPAIYYFELDFFPELYKSKYNKIDSNRLRIDVKPSPSASGVTKIPVSNEMISVLKPESISPDKVVEQTIVARQKNLWDQFFLYMDIEKMLTRDQARKRKYTTLSDMDRNRMIQDYKLDLMQSRIDNAIVAIPESFYIEKTVYTQTEGSVSVIQWFKYDTFREKKRYVYSVQKRDEIWHIYDYTVENLGTE